MTDPIVLVDPLCLCGRAHPCPLHGQWAGQAPHQYQVELNPELLLRLLDDMPGRAA